MAIKVDEKVNLARFTTFHIGGDADYFCRIKGKEELLEAIEWAQKKKIDFKVIGGGSNLLIGDKGYRGLIILNRAGSFEVKDERVVADSGVNLSSVARETVNLGYAGLEFATGIPGTIGGAAAGNAGAYGKDMSMSVLAAEVWKNGKVQEYLNDDFEYVYRSSRFKNNNDMVILSVTIKLEKGDKEQMLELANKDIVKRTSDYGGANAGSYFCNIKFEELTEEQQKKVINATIHGKVVVGKLVQDLGLKGFRVGGALVSENHGGVILNAGDATAMDVLEVERTVTEKVREAYGITLQPEVTKLGEFK